MALLRVRDHMLLMTSYLVTIEPIVAKLYQNVSQG